VEATHGHLIPAADRDLGGQRAVDGVAQTQLTFDVSAPTPEVVRHVDRARVEGIQRDLAVLPSIHAHWARLFGGITRAKIPVCVFAPTPELTTGSKSTAMVLAGVDLGPIVQLAHLLG